MRRDIAAPAKFSDLDWSPAKRAVSLLRVFDHALADTQGASDWYAVAKQPKRRSAQALRMTAIILGTLAAIIPMLSKLDAVKGSATNGAPPWADPILASVALALAAGLAVSDRFLGESSGWVRYVVAWMKLRQEMQGFRIDCEADRASWSDTGPTTEQTLASLKRCREFMTRVGTIMQEETSQWATEFQGAIKQIDAFVKTSGDGQ